MVNTLYESRVSNLIPEHNAAARPVPVLPLDNVAPAPSGITFEVP